MCVKQVDTVEQTNFAKQTDCAIKNDSIVKVKLPSHDLTSSQLQSQNLGGSCHERSQEHCSTSQSSNTERLVDESARVSESVQGTNGLGDESLEDISKNSNTVRSINESNHQFAIETSHNCEEERKEGNSRGIYEENLIKDFRQLKKSSDKICDEPEEKSCDALDRINPLEIEPVQGDIHFPGTFPSKLVLNKLVTFLHICDQNELAYFISC